MVADAVVTDPARPLAPSSLTPARASDRVRRLAAIDMLRGLIMVVMAIDHASYFVARRHPAEYWGGAWTQYDSAAWFLTRFVTHLCAPGFFFLMGAGMALLAASRRKAGWDDGRVRMFLVKRGLLLVVISQLVESLAWGIGLWSSGVPDPASVLIPGATGAASALFSVMTGLGLCVVAGGVLLSLPDPAWWVAGVGVLLASALATPAPEAAAVPFSLPLRLLFLPGQTGGVLVLYPVVPWFGLTALGVLFGRWVRRDQDRAFQAAPWMGVVLCAIALALRAAGGFGNLRPPRDGSWIEFLNLIKYPPALTFSLSMLGVNLLLLALMQATQGAARRLGGWLVVFGQAPLFYYLAHLYLYSIVGAAFFRQGTGLPALYAVWAAGLVPLYFATRRYRDFKHSKPPDSVWRFF